MGLEYLRHHNINYCNHLSLHNQKESDYQGKFKTLIAMALQYNADHTFYDFLNMMET